MTPEDIIAKLGLKPHPEGGHFIETFRPPSAPNERGTVTAIYYLLKAGERSHWHRVDADEIWLWHAGAPLALSIGKQTLKLGQNLADGERPQAIVPAREWQAAESLGDWTLVSCVVAPAFEFSGFELAPPGETPDFG